MLDLQDVTAVYLVENFQPELLQVVEESFRILSSFSMTAYEDTLASLLTTAEDTDPNQLRDNFISIVESEMQQLLVSHFVFLDKDSSPTLKELNELGALLGLIQNLENTDHLSYRVHGAGSGKEIIVDLVAVYSSMAVYRAMEVIESVSDTLIISIRKMIGDREEVRGDDGQRTCWLNFNKFIASTDCLGSRLYKQGYFGLSFEEIVSLSRFNLQTYLSEVAIAKPSQAALDAVSLMLICRDTYELPVASVSKNSQEMFSDPFSIGKIKVIVDKIMSDYSNWSEAVSIGMSSGKGVVS